VLSGKGIGRGLVIIKMCRLSTEQRPPPWWRSGSWCEVLRCEPAGFSRQRLDGTVHVRTICCIGAAGTWAGGRWSGLAIVRHSGHGGGYSTRPASPPGRMVTDTAALSCMNRVAS